MKALLLTASVLSLFACTADTTEPSATEVAAADPVTAALRDVDTGHDLAAARATLERAVKEGAVAEPNRDDVDLALAVAKEGTGDHEAAIASLEALIGRHRNDWARQEDAAKLLVQWVTGTERVASRKRHDPNAVVVAPFAHALAKTIPRPSKDHVEIGIVSFGGDDTSEELGTFRLDDALRQERDEECPLCEHDLSTHTSRSNYGDWTRLPIEFEHFAEKVVIFYFDLEENRIPARYDGYLPMPSAAIEARLATGKGFYAVKQRPSAPAIVLVAAPRSAQLAVVERRLAIATELPTEPVDVPVSPGLLPREIQGSVRASFGAFKACYEALPEPRPSGAFEFTFAIDGQGRPKNVASGNATTLHVPAFTACMLDAASKLTFAATRQTTDTTVRYPITFRPD